MVTGEQFPELFSPITIREMELANRLVMAPMCPNFCTTDGYVTARLLAYYVERGKGGPGLIITESACVDPHGKCISNQLGLWDDRHIAGLRSLVDALHNSGVKVAVQLHHGGKRASKKVTGVQAVSSSSIPIKAKEPDWIGGEAPRVLSEAEIEDFVRKFGECAERAKAANADAIEIHGGHGYLIQNFLSPYSNTRTDSYGGSVEGRTRFAREVVEEVRRRVGNRTPIFFRHTGEEHVQGGIDLAQSKGIVAILEKAGVDVFDISAGNHDAMHYIIPPYPIPRGCNLQVASELRQVLRVPVMAVGRIDAPEFAEQVLKEGKADLVGIGRGLIADPEFPRKAKEGRSGEIRRCIACNAGCIGRSRKLDAKNRSTFTCTLNPMVGREGEIEILPSTRIKRVLVIGGGPGGLEAAVRAASRGHYVTLWEQESNLGGQLNLVRRLPFMAEVSYIPEYYRVQLSNLGVRIELNRRGTIPDIIDFNPEEVVLATGCAPPQVSTPGRDRNRVITAWEALSGEERVGHRAVVLGGKLIGCEVAEYVARQGSKVTIITAQPDMAPDMEPITRRLLRERLKDLSVDLMTSTSVEEITARGVLLKPGGNLVVADTIVVAEGSLSNRELEKGLIGTDLRVHLVGDCIAPRRIINAIHEGFEVGLTI